MSRVITSPIKRWPGTVVLSDPLTFPQVFAFEDAIRAVQAEGKDINQSRVDGMILPGILACVEEWHLENIPEHPTIENFPATPPVSRSRLIAWLIESITELYTEADDVPNG